MIIKPVGFDETKKYPVIEFIYGGMQARQTPHTFFGPLRDLVVRTLARQGFVVVIIDAPGTPGQYPFAMSIRVGNGSKPISVS